MRRAFVIGLVATVAGGSQAFGQAPPPTADVRSPLASHAWVIKPDHGAWVICVKSYAGPQGATLAEALAKEIRATYKVPAYLWEKGSEEKKRQAAFVAQETKRQLASQRDFLDVANKMREQAAIKGMDFLESDTKVRVPRYNLDSQYVVLVGGWKDMESARAELSKIRTWQPPADKGLMDTGVVVRPGADGRPSGETSYLNPFLSALVLPNPVAPKSTAETDPATLAALFRLNEKEPLSALQIDKPFTMAVKSFHPARRGLQDKDGEKSLVQRLFAPDEAAREMQATAQHAVEFAKALRHRDFKPQPVEAYVLHTLYGSVVTVGRFDAPDDPAMVQMQKVLDGIKFTVAEKESGRVDHNVKMFEPMYALQIPRK